MIYTAIASAASLIHFVCMFGLAIDCILGRDPQGWVPHRPPPLAPVLAEADIAPEPSRVV